MKIAILTSGILPVPAVRGGAVENLTDFYLEYNDRHRLHDITVYSVADHAVREHPALRSTANHYHYIDMNSPLSKARRWLFKHGQHAKQSSYHYTIAYFLEQALRDIKQHHYDLILIENRPAYALRLKECVRARVVCHLHNDFLNVSTPHGREIYNATDGIVTVSDYIARRVLTLQDSEAPAPTVKTVHNGIDLNAITPHRENLPPASPQAADLRFTLLFSGRLTPEKGIAYLVEALHLVDRMQPADEAASPVHLLVLGSPFYGNTADEDAFVRQLKERSRALGSRIAFTGFVPYAQVPDYLRKVDVAVIPSVWDDPFPTTTLEALAAGLPVIATRRGGIPEEVDESCAILLDTDEHFTDRLAEAILRLKGDPALRRAMSEAALSRSRRFSKERYAQEFFEAIGEMENG